MIIYAKSVGYTIDKFGNINSKTGKPLILSKSGNYLKFTVNKNGEYGTVKVHSFQAYCKFGNKLFNDGIEVRHLNNNSLDNTFENISIGTKHENHLDKDRETIKKVSIAGAQKLRRFTSDDIRDIRLKKRNGDTLKEIADIYNTSKGHISSIVNYRIYKDQP